MYLTDLSFSYIAKKCMKQWKLFIHLSLIFSQCTKDGLVMMRLNSQKICRWSYEHNVDNIAMGWDLVNKDILEICNRYHLDVYVNTVNKADEAKQLLKDGVKGIYTDRLSASDFKED